MMRERNCRIGTRDAIGRLVTADDCTCERCRNARKCIGGLGCPCAGCSLARHLVDAGFGDH